MTTYTLPSTEHRVAEHTAPEVNERIARHMEERIVHTLHARDIEGRMDDLDREWNTERALLTNYGVVALAGIVFALARGSRLPLLTTVASGFMLQHALQGWCPPLALFRRLGLRSPGEIERERAALEALRTASNGSARALLSSDTPSAPA